MSNFKKIIEKINYEYQNKSIGNDILCLKKFDFEHQNLINRYLHILSISFLVLAVMSFLNYAHPILLISVTAFTFVYYWIYHTNIFIISWIVQYSVYYFTIQNFQIFHDLLSITIVFITGVCIALLGHKIEGSKPRFTEEIRTLMIGPIWLWRFLLPASIRSKFKIH